MVNASDTCVKPPERWSNSCKCPSKAGGCLKLTCLKKDLLIALILVTGADEELRAHALSLFHFTLAAVVILQEQAVQFLSRVVAHGIKGDIVVFLPPWKEKIL